MNCEDKQRAFQDKLVETQTALRSELESISTETERKAKEIETDFDTDSDLAAGIGAVAGSTVGGLVGGVPGAAVGGIVGREIGNLFTMEVGMHRQTIVLDVPQATMATQDFSFDLPVVVMNDTDIIFDVPTVEMQTVEGPKIPETTVRMELKCIGPRWARVCTDVPVTVITWKQTYLDVPVTVMKQQRIVIGIPAVTMQRQEIRLDVPQIAMRPTEFSVNVPYITLRFKKDAGRRTAALAAALAQSAQEAANQKQIGFRDRLRTEVAPLATDMFNCFRETIAAGRADAAARFAPQIATLTAAVTAIVAKGVPADDAELVAAKALLDRAIVQRDEALKSFDDALRQLEASAKSSLSQFLGDGLAEGDAGINLLFSEDRSRLRPGTIGGLIRFSLADSQAESKTTSQIPA